MKDIEEKTAFVGCGCLAVVLLSWGVVCVFTEIKSTRNEPAKSRRWEVEQMAFEKNPPAEYSELEATVRRLRGELQQKCKGYCEAFDLLQITNVSRTAGIISNISKMQIASEKIDMELEFAFVDAKIHFAKNKYVLNKIDGLYYSDRRYYSMKNLSCLKRTYLLLDKYRALWFVKDGDFEFSNFELEMAYQNLMAEMEDEDIDERNKALQGERE